MKRVDDDGRAYAGSQLQIQIYVNRRTEELNRAVLDALPSLAALNPRRLRWVSPREEDKFVEYYDGGFLQALGLEDLWESLRKFWPARGPHWDALATVDIAIPPYRGVVLVEAKSHRKEMYDKRGCGATNPNSCDMIKRALCGTKGWLHVTDHVNWTGRLYQYANRLAHLYFFREVVCVPAWLVNVYFVADPQCPPPHLPMSRVQWRAALARAKTELGLAGVAIPFAGDLFLEGKERRELTG